MDKTIYTKTCDAIGKNERRCDAENSHTINISITFQATNEPDEKRTMKFDICPTHSASMLETALAWLYVANPQTFDAIINKFFQNNPPTWRTQIEQ